jgi:hypothetical protein
LSRTYTNSTLLSSFGEESTTKKKKKKNTRQIKRGKSMDIRVKRQGSNYPLNRKNVRLGRKSTQEKHLEKGACTSF